MMNNIFPATYRISSLDRGWLVITVGFEQGQKSSGRLSHDYICCWCLAMSFVMGNLQSFVTWTRMQAQI